MMARKKKAAPAEAAPESYETKRYPPDQVAREVAGAPILPPPPDFGHFTDPGIRAEAPAFELSPYAVEPETPQVPLGLAPDAATPGETTLPNYLISSDGTLLPPPAAGRRVQLAWLAAAAVLIGLSLFYWLRPSAPPAPGSVAAYERAAKQGDVHAMRTLGAWYTYGLNVKQDPAKGVQWYRRAAEAGDPVAQQELKAIEGK